MWLIALCVAALTGIAVGDVGRLEPSRLLFTGVVALLGARLAWQRRAWRLLALVSLAAALGGLRASLVARDDTAAALAPYLGLAVRLRGEVVQPPGSGPATTQLLVDAHAIGLAGRDPPADGAVPPETSTALSTASPRGSPTALSTPSPRGSPTASFGASPAGSPGESPSAPNSGPPTAAGSVTGATPARVRVVGDSSTLAPLAAGETVVLEGRLLPSDRPGPPTLLFPKLLARQPGPAVERSSPSALLAGVRAAAQAAVERYLPEPQASLAAGVLLGGAGRLDADFRLQLQRSGLAHVVAIDGFKQVVVAAMLGGVAVRLLGPRAAALPVLLGIAGYTVLTGAHPAAVRAGLMVGLATLAALGGRVADPLTSVVVAATLMATVDPRVLLDVGLQLSLSATLGIVLLWRRVRPCLKGVPRFVAEPAGLTVAVTLATLPVTLSAFQLVSLVSPVAHILAVPLLPVVLLSTGLLALVSPIPPLAAAVAWLAWLPATLLVATIRVFGSQPGAALSTGRLPPLAAASVAVALLAWGLWGLPEMSGWRQHLRAVAARGSRGIRFIGELPEGSSARRARLAPPAACLATCLAATALLQVVRPDGRLHVRTLTQSRGEAVFIRGPTGRTALVVAGRLDGGYLATQVSDCLAVWEHGLDAVLQLDPDAPTGLGPTLARYPAERRLNPAEDTRLELGGGAVLDVYASDGRRQLSPAVSISFGRVWLPLTGYPPPPTSVDGDPAVTYTTNADVVSDGREAWSAAAETEPQPEPADVPVPSAQFAFAAQVR